MSALIRSTDFEHSRQVAKISALLSRRSYKVPWESDKVCAYLMELSGKQFDRQFVTLLVNHKAQVMTLYEAGKNA